MTPTFASNAVADIPLSVDEQGVIRIGDSGVLLESVMRLRRDGATANETLDGFTSPDGGVAWPTWMDVGCHAQIAKQGEHAERGMTAVWPSRDGWVPQARDA